MSDALFPYYERELTYLRQSAQEFARKYPAAAGRLLLEPNISADPHVERLIESFALLAGRIHKKLDDELPEITEAMLGVLAPHLLAPIPSLTMVQFVMDPFRGQFPDGFSVPVGSKLATPPIRDVPCQYRTCYPVTLWPIGVGAASLIAPPFPAELRPPPRAAAALRLRLDALGKTTFPELNLRTLRLYLDGQPQTIAPLYELIFNHVVGLEWRIAPGPGAPAGPRVVPADPSTTLRQVGFERDEGLFPYPLRSFPGYRLLTELFVFPNKFWFLDLINLNPGDWHASVELVTYFDTGSVVLEQAVGADTFRLGCTPAANLFEKTAEPLPVTQRLPSYRIIPDVGQAHALEVYSVDEVIAIDPNRPEPVEYRPFYAVRHRRRGQPDPRCFWHATRHLPAREGDRGTEVELALVDLDFTPAHPAEETLIVRTTCTNRDLPMLLQAAGERLSFQLEMAAPVAAIRCLRSPTAPLRPPMGRGIRWRLISHLSLNHLSLTDDSYGLEAFREILRIYDFSDPEQGQARSDVTARLIEGVVGLSSRRTVGRVGGLAGEADLCRGVEVTLELDEPNYVGTGAFLFASVIERFLALYASINSFTRLVAKLRQDDRPFHVWPPRSGDHELI